MNVNFNVDNDQIDNIIVTQRKAGFEIVYNNFVFSIIIKNALKFTKNYKVFSTHRINTFPGSYVCLIYQLVFNPDTFTSIKNGPKPKKILRISGIKDFDLFTNKYGKVFINSIVIKWKNVSKHYSGIDIYASLSKRKLEELIKKRHKWCFYKGKKYKSWLEGEVFTMGGYIWRTGEIKDMKFKKCIPLPAPRRPSRRLKKKKRR